MSKHIKSISNPKLKLEILTTEEVQKIHEATLWIIEHVGVRFPSQRALGIWEANGATVDREEEDRARQRRCDRRGAEEMSARVFASRA